MKNILIIGYSGHGKSLLSATLTDNYEKFPISHSADRNYEEGEFKDFVTYNYQDTYTIMDWEGEKTKENFKKLISSQKCE